MSNSRGKARARGVLLLACCALFLRQCVSLRELQREHGAQRRVQTVETVGASSRELQEAFEGDYDEDEELESQPKLGTGISRLGIHGEGLGYVSHNLLESDSEFMALAAAVKSGAAKATGRGAQSSGSDDEGRPTRFSIAREWPMWHGRHRLFCIAKAYFRCPVLRHCTERPPACRHTVCIIQGLFYMLLRYNTIRAHCISLQEIW